MVELTLMAALPVVAVVQVHVVPVQPDEGKT
jgi:hypothetical protein